MRLRVLGGLRLAAVLLAAPAAAAPFVPASDNVVLERVTASADPAGAALRRDPSDRALAMEVARRAILRGQASADPRFFGRAEAALAPWIGAADPPAGIRLLRAILRQSNHDFAGALDDLGVVLADAPRNGQARLTRAVVRLVRGEYDDAAEDCGQLVSAAPPGAMDACVAAVAGLTGHARPALVMLSQVAAAPDTPPAIRVWALTLAGEASARLGDVSGALAAFERARALAPDDVYLLAAEADALLDAGRAGDAAALLDGRTRADVLLLRLAEAAQRSGRPDPALPGQLADRFETSRRRGETIHQREEARFTLRLLGRPAEALRLAQANWQVQREPADARILLEAALEAGVPEAAAPAVLWRHAGGLEDVQLARLEAALAEGVP